MDSFLFFIKLCRGQNSETVRNHLSFFLASSINRTYSVLNNISSRRWCQRHREGDEFCPRSYQEHIRCNLPSIQWQSAFSPITSCHLPLHTWEREEKADGVTVWWRELEMKKKERGGGRKWDHLRRIKTERGFKGVVTCTYVSLGLILWMTSLHLGVITALLLTLLFPVVPFSVLLIHRPGSAPTVRTVVVDRLHVFAVPAGSSYVLRTAPDNRQMCTWNILQGLSCSPPVFAGTAKITNAGPSAGNMLPAYFHKMWALVRETIAESANMEESEAKLCIQAFLIKIKAFIIKHKCLYIVIDCIWYKLKTLKCYCSHRE